MIYQDIQLSLNIRCTSKNEIQNFLFSNFDLLNLTLDKTML